MWDSRNFIGRNLCVGHMCNLLRKAKKEKEVNSDNQEHIHFREVVQVIVETIKRGECTCYIDDSGYVNKTQEEVQEIIKRYSEFIAACLQKRKTA